MTVVLSIRRPRISREVVDAAAGTVRKGGILLYPTDTIYGLGGNALDGRVVERIFAVKRRREDKPVLVLVPNRRSVGSLVSEISPLARRLMKQFWPGPLTILLPARGSVHPLLKGNSEKIGIRIPDNRFCLRLLSACSLPLVSTSANFSGGRQADSFVVLRRQFTGHVDLIIDAGDVESPVPSTIVDVTSGRIEIVREGAIPARAFLHLAQVR